jgi:hypothetical protein
MLSTREKSDYSFEEFSESETKENYNIAVDFLGQVGDLIQQIKLETVKI